MPRQGWWNVRLASQRQYIGDPPRVRFLSVFLTDAGVYTGANAYMRHAT